MLDGGHAERVFMATYIVILATAVGVFGATSSPWWGLIALGALTAVFFTGACAAWTVIERFERPAQTPHPSEQQPEGLVPGGDKQ